MKQLAKFYDDLAAVDSGNDFLTQVGHTLCGKPIARQQFNLMVGHLSSALDLRPEDRLLDLCCGNGVITQHLARHVHSVVGIDFSEALIGIAREHHQLENTRYHVLDALDLVRLGELEDMRFNKVLMHGALQHFPTSDLERLIGNILAVSMENPLILISHIPEKSKQDLFYDTPKRRRSRNISRTRGLDLFGTWWAYDFIETTCKSLDRQSKCLPMDERLEVARYRFNVTIS